MGGGGGGDAGGICGQQTGKGGGIVIITNVYASGDIIDAEAAGIIGHVDGSSQEINVTMSVYNGGPLVGRNDNPGSFTSNKNSEHLDDIIGNVYCYENGAQECWNTSRPSDFTVSLFHCNDCIAQNISNNDG